MTGREKERRRISTKVYVPFDRVYDMNGAAMTPPLGRE